MRCGIVTASGMLQMCEPEHMEGRRTRTPQPEQHPLWSQVLRALRETDRATQAGWAARLAVSRSTVQRWERGETVPDPDMERAIIAHCQARGLFRAFDNGPFAGEALTAIRLRDLLGAARLYIVEERVGYRAPRRAPYRLVERIGGDTAKVYVLEGAITTIGRDLDNEIVVADSRASRRHAEVRWDGMACTLHDLGSKNGTFLNGRRITGPHALQAGDVIALAGLPDLAWVFGPSEATITFDPEEAVEESG